jgi:MFS family permease
MFELPNWPAWAIRTFVGMAAFTLGIYGFSLKRAGAEGETQKPSGKKLGDFRAFQRQFLIVYCIIMTADWLQGTNMYTLYMSYNVSISTLFITGFTSSAIFGTIVGLYVDKWGRKVGCIVYLVLEIIINILEHFNNFPVLMIGRVLGGISTSLLFSAFETWMVCEHRKRGFHNDWLADTFSTMSFINGLSAIVSGLVAQLIADQLGEIGPFQAAIAMTALALVFVIFWPENYGSDDVEEKKEDEQKDAKKGNGKKEEIETEKKPGQDGVMNFILSDKKVILVGMVNSIFEGTMYSFVFMWVPAMGKLVGFANLPTGLVFSCLMVCISLGGLLFSPTMLLSVLPAEKVGILIFIVGACALLVPVFFFSLVPVLASFLVFETCVGLFFPCMGYLRSKVIPDSIQGSVMNVFRVPLNIFVVVGTSLTDIYPIQTVFSIITTWLVAGTVLQFMLSQSLGATTEEKKTK